MLSPTEMYMSEIDWKALEEQLRKFQIGEKVSDDIDTRYAELMKNFMGVKPEEWSEKIRPLIKGIMDSYKDDPEEAVETFVGVLMKMTHQVAQHDILIDYLVTLQAQIIESSGIESQKTSKILRALYNKGVLSPEEMGE
jgi:hypothetical protein